MSVPEIDRGGKWRALKAYSVVDHVCESRRSQRLFKRNDNPTLPARHPLYAQAKKLEYDGDIAGALDFLYRAMMNGERIDSCLKDIAGLLNMMGRTTEAVAFLKSHSDRVTNRSGYSNLLMKLEAELDKDGGSDLPRAITITVVDFALGPVNMSLCDRLFPNPGKIRRILHTDDNGFVGTVHFASHSSARKALQVQKLSSIGILCTWSSEYIEIQLRDLEKAESRLTPEMDYKSEYLPHHLVAFGGVDSIPIYHADEHSGMKTSQSSSGKTMDNIHFALHSPTVSAITPTSQAVSTPDSSLLSSLTGSARKSTASSERGSRRTTTKSVDLAPYITKIRNSTGEMVSAMVIPLPSTGLSESEQIRVYAETLSTMATAVANVGSLIDSSTTRSNLSDDYTTPLKRRPYTSFCYKTPSPVVDRYIFT